MLVKIDQPKFYEKSEKYLKRAVVNLNLTKKFCTAILDHFQAIKKILGFEPLSPRGLGGGVR